MAIPSNDAILAQLKGKTATPTKVALPSHAEIVSNLGSSYSALPKPQMTNFTPLDVQPFADTGTMGTKTFADYTPAIQNAPSQIKEGINRMILADTNGNIIPKPQSFKDTVFSDLKQIWTAPLTANKPFTPVNYLTDIYGPAGTAGEGGLVGDTYKAWQKAVETSKTTVSLRGNAQAIALTKTGLDAIDAFFTPVSSALQRTATYKGLIGGEADFFNRLFQSVGVLGGDSLAKMVQETPGLTQAQKDVAAPLAQRIGALGAQIVLGKATEGTFTEMKNTTHDMLSKTLDLYKKSSLRERQLGAIKNPFFAPEEGKPEVSPEIKKNAEKIATQLGIQPEKYYHGANAPTAEKIKASGFRGSVTSPGYGMVSLTPDAKIAEGYTTVPEHVGKPAVKGEVFAVKLKPNLKVKTYNSMGDYVKAMEATGEKTSAEMETSVNAPYDVIKINDLVLAKPSAIDYGVKHTVPEGVQEAEILGIAAAENNQPPKQPIPKELQPLAEMAKNFKTEGRTLEEFKTFIAHDLPEDIKNTVNKYRDTDGKDMSIDELFNGADGTITQSVRTIEETPALEGQIKDIVGEEQIAKIPKLEEQIDSLKKEMETAVGDIRDAVLEELNAAVKERNTIQDQVRSLQDRIRAQANLYTKASENTAKIFNESKGQRKIGNTDFEIGDFGRSSQARKLDIKGDRFPESQLANTLENVYAVQRASNDRTSLRYDNIAHIAVMPDGEVRAVYTRLNRNGAEEVVNWHTISKENYLDSLLSFGTPDGTRTHNLAVRTGQLHPLSFGSKSILADKVLAVKSAEQVPEDVLKKAEKDWAENYAAKYAKLDTAGQLKLEQEFKDKWEPLAKPQTIQDNLPDVPGIETPAETFGGTVPPAEHRSFNSLIGDFFRGLKGAAKVHFLDYLKTPEFVLEKLGLGKEAQMLHEANDVYRSTLKKEVSVVQGWKDRVDESLKTKYRMTDSGQYVKDEKNGLTISPEEASRIIFKYLDGDELGMKSQMNPEMYKVAREIRDYLGDWADRLKLPDDARVSRYITRLFDTDVTRPGFEEGMDPELAAIMRDKVAGSVYDPFLQRRLGMQGYKQDVWAALDAYVKRGSRKEAFDPALEALDEAAKKLDPLSYDYVKKFSHLVNMRPTELDKLIDSFIKQSPLAGKLGERPVARITQKLRQAYYRGFLALNPASALRNLSQGANTYAKLGEKYTTIGYTQLFSKMMRRDLQELYDQNVLDDAFVQDRKIGVYKTALQKLDPVLFSMFDTAEKINRGAAYFGAKEKFLAQGMNEEKAIQAAKRIVRETQFAFGRVDTPVALNQDIIKVFTQLGTYNIKQIEFLSRMVKNGEFAGLIRYTAASLVFVYTIGKLFGMTVQQLIPSVGLGNAPAVSTAMNIATAVNPSTNAKDRAAAQKKVVTGFLGLIPGGLQARKTFQGGQAMGEGKSVGATGKTQYNIAQTPTNFVRAILFGKSALPEAQESFSSGDTLRKGLEEQTSASAQLGLEAEQKWTELKNLKASQGPEAAKVEWNQIAKDNPLLLDRIKQIAKDEELGLDSNDRLLKMYGVANGMRAKYIADEINALKTKAEKQALWRNYVTKKIITPEVAKQIEPLLN